MNYSTYDISSYARGMDSAAYGVSDDLAVAAIMSALATYSIIVLVVAILEVIGLWKMFSKAGEKGWKSIIPIYNVVILFKICGLSPWLLLVYFAAIIPFIGWIAVLLLSIFQAIYLAKSFGKGTGFTVGLIFLQPIFTMILGFGSATYVGPAAKNTTNA